MVAFSDEVVRTFAGDGYFPLLKALEGAAANANHRALVALADMGKVTDIITPNFDTLIELAFRQSDVHLEVFVRPADYRPIQVRSATTRRLHKIHGSVTDPKSLVDTVTQKVRGIVPETRQALTKIFREHHVLFVGFSGADFDFDPDYLPMRANAEGGHGFTWLYRKGLPPPAIVSRFSNSGGVAVEDDPPDFFARLGVPEATLAKRSSTSGPIP